MKTILLTLAWLLFSSGLFAQCYVSDVPSVDQGASTCYINDVTVDAVAYSTNSGIQSIGNSYQSFLTSYIPMSQGQQLQIFVGGTNSTLFNQCIWIDFNSDSIFTGAELVAFSVNANFSSHNYTVNVPYDAVPDTVRMRVMKLQSATGWGGGNDDACFDYNVGGEVEDYTVIISCGNFNFANFDPFPFMCYADSVQLFANTPYGDITWYTDSSAALVHTGNDYWLRLNGFTQDTSVFIQNTASGCFDGPLLEMFITITPSPVVNILGPDTVQSCSVVTLDAGAGHNTYMWSNGDQTQTTTITNGYGGNLSVTVDNQFGCFATDQVWVNIAPNPPATYAHLSPDVSFCSTLGIYLHYDSLINPGTVNWYTYPSNVFIDSGSWINYTLPDTGFYQYTAIINSICGTDTALVSIYAEGPPTYDSAASTSGIADSNGVFNLCPGSGLADLYLTGLTGYVDHWEIGDIVNGNWFNWNDDDTLDIPVMMLIPGNMYAAIATTMNAQWCQSVSDTIYFTMANSLAYNLSDTIWRCSFPQTISIPSVNYGIYDILWSTGDTTNTTTVNAPGNFTLYVIDHSTGCTINDQQYVGDGTLPENPYPDTIVSCQSQVYLDPQQFGYLPMSWEEYETNWQFINSSFNGDLWITDNGFDEYVILNAQNLHGCMVIDTMLIDFGGTFSFSLGPDVSTMSTPYILTAPAGYPIYAWTPAEPNSNTIAVYVTTTYTLMIDNGQGCTYSDVITITILPTEITNTSSQAEVNVFPNPANDHVTVQSSSSISQVNIYDLDGRLISTNTYNTTQAEINISELPAGCYILEAVTEEGNSRSRLLKQQ